MEVAEVYNVLEGCLIKTLNNYDPDYMDKVRAVVVAVEEQSALHASPRKRPLRTTGLAGPKGAGHQVAPERAGSSIPPNHAAARWSDMPQPPSCSKDTAIGPHPGEELRKA